MKGNIKRDAIAPFRELRRRSPMPYLLAGIACLLFGRIRPMFRLTDYALAVGITVIAFYVARGIWPDEKIRIDLPPDTGDAQADQLVLEAREALAAFRSANDRIADEKISATIEGIESACVKILARLEENPGLHSQLRTFLRYYLPTTRKIMDARASIEAGGITSDNAKVIVARADRVLPEIRRAFEKQLDALDKHKYLDIQVEMDVLEGMLKSDGLTDSIRI